MWGLGEEGGGGGDGGGAGGGERDGCAGRGDLAEVERRGMTGGAGEGR